MVATLTVWEGDYGVASVDTNCLILLTYVKMAKVQCNIKYSSNPLFNLLPCLTIEEENVRKNIYGFDEIWEYIRTSVFDIDHFMYQEQKSESIAYNKFIVTNFLPGKHYTMWVDQQNYIDVTRKWYRNALYFPINYFYPYYKCKEMTRYVEAVTPEENLEEFSPQLIESAKKCILDLSMKLGNKNYFFGDNPSSLDAVVYGYLAPFLNIPLPVSVLQTYLKEQINLVKFVKRITTTYFPQQKFEYKYVDQLNREEDMQDYKTPPKTIALAAIFATAAMITYGIMNGIIKLPSSNS